MKTRILLLALSLLICSGGAKAWALSKEDFGNSPLGDHYPDSPGILPLVNSPSRVYRVWGMGGERLYFRGDTAALNDSLRKFAAMKAEVHEVVLRPGPGVTHSFDEKPIPFQWDLCIVDGIGRHALELPQGDKVCPKSPMLSVYVAGQIDLKKIEIPKGVSVLEPADLGRRYREALTSKDNTIRTMAAYELADLDPYDAKNLAAIANLLKDENDGMRANAVSALTDFGKKAEVALPALRELLGTKNENLKAVVEKAIEEIQHAKADEAAEREHRAMLGRIRASQLFPH
jgi:hypothetical protein